jgi:hypothetical protein
MFVTGDPQPHPARLMFVNAANRRMRHSRPPTGVNTPNTLGPPMSGNQRPGDLDRKLPENFAARGPRQLCCRSHSMWHIADTGVAGLTAEGFNDGRTDVPAGAAEPVERVVVVGAGIAGLTVANALAHAGVECVVVEARDRIGGRLHTVDLAGSPVDLGGSWIHTPVGNPMRAFAQHADVSCRSANPLPELAGFDCGEGRRLSAAEVEASLSMQLEGFPRRWAGCSPNPGRMRPQRMGSTPLWPGLAWRPAQRGGRARHCARLLRPSQPTSPSASRCAGCGARSNTRVTISATCPWGALPASGGKDGDRR